MYVLTLRTTKKGRYVVDRSDWIEFPCEGDWCRTNTRPVSGAYADRDKTKEFASAYVREHPGHTGDPAASREEDS